MIDVASDALGEVQQSSEMMPRRWYTSETAPLQHHRLRLTTNTWRYCAMNRRQHDDAVPITGAASSFRHQPLAQCPAA